MAQTSTAVGRLRAGDLVQRALDRGASLEAAASTVGLTTAAASKARWLASVYPRQERRQLGDALTRLTPTHLEVAAAAGPARVELLRQAASAGLTVRALRQEIARGPRAGSRKPPVIEVLGGRGELERTSAALERYAASPQRQLDRLLAGPNGDVVRQLAAAGNALFTRLASAS
jgi:hypothetical protein